MYAVVNILGQQFKVQKDQKVIIHRLDSEAGKSVEFSDVVLVDNGGKVKVGAPTVKGASVSAKVLSHLRGDKVIIFKKKRRQNYRRKNGHRQNMTVLEITDIKAA